LAPVDGASVIASSYKFGEFELDCARYELRRNGRTLKLERIPMELLILLAEKDGNVVTRQEIVERLWGKDVFVDTEHGINTAIRKIRSALKDDPEQPRFIQTVTGKGYRFVAERQNGNHASAGLLEPVVSPAQAADLPAKSRRMWPIMVALIALCLAAGGLLLFNSGGIRARLFPSSQRQIRSIAVLPLANLSGDPSQDYFADGMTDELITMLAKNTSLRVVSRTSAMQYKNAKRPVGEIARELGVDGILEGSVEKSGNHVHMTVQLIHASRDTHVWAESYDRTLSEAFSLPSDLSQTIAKEIKTAISPVEPQHPINPDAHDAYLRGRYSWFNRDMQRSQEYFEKAIQMQPDYAAAWSGLADSYTVRAVDGTSFPSTVMGKAEEAARKAIELDDSLSDAHKARAALYLFDTWEWQHAEAEILRAIELDPKNSEAHHLYSYLLFVTQRPDKALEEQKQATELDPFARPWAMGHAYILLRQFDIAIKELRLINEIQPHNALVRFMLSQAYWLKGMWKESEQELEEGMRLIGNAKVAEAEHRAFERGGEKAVEQFGVDDINATARKHYVAAWDMASQYAYLGDKENTLKFLEAALKERCPWVVFLQNEPIFDFLHNQPRYQELVKKIGLPPAR
jgi:TolB-like protein/DNA-binding winged helix-turn-helix (wHTH) protein/Tfp pilus assembly protein PilF